MKYISAVTSIFMLAAACGVVAAESGAVSSETAAAPLPAGLQVMYAGNSWFNFVPGGVADLVKSAGIQGHQEVRFPKPNDFSAIDAGTIDVYTHGIHWWGEIINSADQILARGLKANPNFRLYNQAAWSVGDGRSSFPEGRRTPTKTVADYDNSDIADLRAMTRAGLRGIEKKVDALNAKYGKRVVFLIPVGYAVVNLREMIVAGTFPGVTRQSSLWNDAMPHPGSIVMALQSYCQFVALYRMSPVGLKMNRFSNVTEAQHAILQQIAWDTVSEYPYAGVKETASLVPAEKADITAETDVAPAGSMPELLKGWKTVTELPVEEIVTDYNAYIKELPAAERAGVADVQYFKDGAGQNAVGVKVNADNKQWLHILVYDNQNKRVKASKATLQ